MAKKTIAHAPVTIIDEDGYETDEMFRSGGLKSSKEWIDSFNFDIGQSAIDRIARMRKAMTSFVQPHVDGPYNSSHLPKASQGVALARLNLSIGSGLYLIKSDVSRFGYVVDACAALKELDTLSKLIAEEPPNIDRIVRSSAIAGMLFTRTKLRAMFGPDVLTAKKRRKASAKGGKATAKWTPKVADLAGAIFADEKRSKVSDFAAYKRTTAKLKARHGVSISVSTLTRRLSTK